MPTDRARRVDEKNGINCLFIMFTLRDMVIKMSKNGSFFVFSAVNSKTLVTVWATYVSAPEKSDRVLSENDIVNKI